jgi:hypothetical protein
MLAWLFRCKEGARPRFSAKAGEIDLRAGAAWKIVCDSRWADEATPYWGVLEHPDPDCYQVKVAGLEELRWWRYFDLRRVLGTLMED